MTFAPRTTAGLLALTACLMYGCGDSSEPARTTTSAGRVQLGPAFQSMGTLPGVLESRPPWPANNGAELQLRLRKIGLSPLSEEGPGRPHPPAPRPVRRRPQDHRSGERRDRRVGRVHHRAAHPRPDRDPPRRVPHGEHVQPRQFFAVWGVRLDRKCIGGVCAGAGKQLRMWVNGKPVDADPTRIVLDAHQEIVLAYGTAAQMPKPVPSTYSFPAGL